MPDFGVLLLAIILVLGTACLMVWAGGDVKIDYPSDERSFWERLLR